MEQTKSHHKYKSDFRSDEYYLSSGDKALNKSHQVTNLSHRYSLSPRCHFHRHYQNYLLFPPFCMSTAKVNKKLNKKITKDTAVMN